MKENQFQAMMHELQTQTTVLEQTEKCLKELIGPTDEESNPHDILTVLSTLFIDIENFLETKTGWGRNELKRGIGQLFHNAELPWREAAGCTSITRKGDEGVFISEEEFDLAERELESAKCGDKRRIE